MKDIWVIAHRGGHGTYRENTLQAFEDALKKGSDAVEMDVRYDHLRNRFYLEHDFFHLPTKNSNTVDKIVPHLPQKTFYYVELKTISWLTKHFARKFVASFKKYFTRENSVVMSFNPIVLIHLKMIAPEISRGYLLGNPMWNFFYKLGLHRVIAPKIVLLHKRLFSLKNVQFARKCGYKVVTFILNKPAQWQKAVDFGVDGIVTDFPKELRQFLDAKGS